MSTVTLTGEEADNAARATTGAKDAARVAHEAQHAAAALTIATAQKHGLPVDGRHAWKRNDDGSVTLSVRGCHGCGQYLPERVERGGLVVQRDPSVVFWRGERVEMKPALASMLRLFVRFGDVPHEALDNVHCGTAVKTTWDMLGRLRKALAAVTDEVKIKNVRGWGYRIEISE
jgi:hypothetical protein